MSESQKNVWTETLPEPLPVNPLQLAADWLAQARTDAAQPNPNSMVLATVDGRGQPSARVVLCKDIAAEAGFITFYTNYLSRKGRELEMNPRAAVVFHWDHRHRQVRAEGRVARLPTADSDAYYASHVYQPAFLEGTKTLAYELWEQSGFQAPDNLVIPLGYGSNVLGADRGFAELAHTGEIAAGPRLFGVQAARSRPSRTTRSLSLGAPSRSSRAPDHGPRRS